MRENRMKQIKDYFRREPSKFTFEPVEHKLEPQPVLPKSMMAAIAPAYEEKLAQEKEQEAPKSHLGKWFM